VGEGAARARRRAWVLARYRVAPAGPRPPLRDAAPGDASRRVVAVVPAYNEERTLGDVLAVLRQVPAVHAVFVISDGSTDGTAEVARAGGATCIELSQNVGKGGALKAGVDRADADVYLFLDADLIGLRPDHVLRLLEPVLSGEAQMSVGILEKGRVATDLAQAVAPYLSGQRAVTRDILRGLPSMETTRYGIEVAINRYLKKNGITVQVVPLESITHRTKEEKLGLLRGFVARMKMYWEIVRYAGE
jgi:glycosyltransferase involved in cell wall biosynthesis